MEPLFCFQLIVGRLCAEPINVGVQGLELGVQIGCPQHAALHRSQDLDVPPGIEGKTARQALADHERNEDDGS